ncbi:MAG TPA: protein kinase [Gemmataceae bacterium]|jgi:mono/diheme cytochrome c family protein
MPVESPQTPQREQSLEDIVLAYLQDADAGRDPDPRAVMAQHPEWAEELAKFFADEDHLADLLSPLRIPNPTESIATIAAATPEEVVGGTPPADDCPPPRIPGYEILSFQGKGGMGVVYKALQISLNRIVALKMILSHRLADPDARTRFNVEARTVARLDHANIVHIWDHGAHDDRPYLSLEFVEGGSLADQTKGVAWPPRKAATLTAVLADAVEHAHQQGVVHRDLKPANVLLTVGGVPKIADFGLARSMQADAAGLTQAGDLVGTPAYMTPEQAEGRHEAVGRETDVFGLGTILYELLTGRPPYQGGTVKQVIEQAQQGWMRTPRQLQPRIPRALERICLKALATDPRQRYATAAALAADLRRYLRQPVRRAVTAAVSMGLRLFNRDIKIGIMVRWAVTAAVSIGLLVGGLGVWLAFWPPPPPEKPASPGPNSEPEVLLPAELAEKAHQVLRANCYRCHGQDGAVEGGFNYVLDHKQLVTRGKKIVPGDPQKSQLLQRIKNGEMPPEDEQPRPSEADIADLEKWIAAGAPEFNAPPYPDPERKFLADEDVLRFIRSDLQKANQTQRRFLRYFTITHLYNAGLPEDALQSYRFGLAKLVNNLSWRREIVVPAAIDPQRTVFRIDLRDLQWDEKVWERILKAYPYGVSHDSDSAQFVYKATECRLPHVRADWFVFDASRPPLYHEVLQLPTTARKLEELLRVNVAEDIRKLRVARSGFNNSGVSNNNRLIERHVSIHGSYWRSYDFAAPKGGRDDRKNLLQHPLGPEPVKNAFRPDGGEIIFSLPNGLHGYMLVNAAGGRIDRGPLEIVKDPKQRDGAAVINGISCMSCHTRGLIDKPDRILTHVEKNHLSFTRDELETVRALYPRPEQFRALLEKDNKRFAAAAQATGAQFGRTDPIVALASRYEWELDVDLAAAESGLKRAEFLERLGQSIELSRVLGLRNKGGTVQRKVWEDNFGSLVRELKLGVFHPPFHEEPGLPPSPPPVDKDVLVNSIDMKFKRLPGRDFLMGVYEVTQGEYQKVMGGKPSEYKGPHWEQHPVERVSWKEAVEFCKKLSARPEEKGRVYRLPFEEEWEYACRAGAKTAYSFGNDAAKLSEHAWFTDNAEEKTHEVGTRKANPWGLHDMHGNVREWCADDAATLRFLRGGSYKDSAEACRADSRPGSFEDFNNDSGYGFRVVLIREK